MADTTYDVIGIGNAIVDVLAPSEDDFLVADGLAKGSMRLIDEVEAERLYARMGPAVETSGGSAANTIAGLASLGADAAFIGKVRDDLLGQVFGHDIRALGVGFDTTPATEGAATARCMILVTPDGERTMNTFLGASRELTTDDIDPGLIQSSSTLYLEGYLWDPDNAKKAFVKASEIARAAGREVALTLSDGFCVDRFRDEFLELIRSGQVTIVFANEHEARALYQTGDIETAVDALAKDVPLAVVTRGEEGATVVTGDSRVSVPAAETSNVVDLTGAGDLFAGGFLFGLARNYPLDAAARLGTLCAAHVIGHMGPRPQRSLKALAAESGFST
ncbi:MAG: adenosine kinase [Pseudomonadota bacterium]